MRSASGFLRFVIGCVVLVAAGSATAAELVAEVIRLQHRSVEQVLPLIAPLVSKPGTVGGTGSELVVRTTRSALREIKQVIAAIDRMPKQLLVTVRHDAAADPALDTTGTRLSGSRVYGTRNADGDRAVQRVRVGEGESAYVHVGQSVPVILRGSRGRHSNGRAAESGGLVVFRDMISGFSVRPRIAGERVVVEVVPTHDTPAGSGPGSASIQRAATTVSARLGEWIEVAAIQPGDVHGLDGTSVSTRQADPRARRILLRVDVID